jgi:hypothetical protein
VPAKERNQNPVVGDELTLRLFTYNSNHRQPVDLVEKVEVFRIDPSCADEDNPEGRTLVAEFSADQVEEVSDSFGGHYRVSFLVESELFTIGRYVDVWTVRFSENQSGTVTNEFAVLSDLWYASDMPVVYDFSYGFRPNRVRKGERRWITVEVVPNVPRSSDLERYYTNLAMASPVRISVEKACGECVPKEKDLRLVVDKAPVEFRRDSEGYYFLDTVALGMDCGIYNVWFDLEFGESSYISDNLQLQVY